MNNKTGYGLRIVLGGYLAYLGIRMLIQTINDRPANMMFMGVMAVLFAVVGIAYAVYSLKKVWEMRKEEMKSPEDDGSEPDIYQEEAAEEEAKTEEKTSEVSAEKVSDEKTEETPDAVSEGRAEEIENDYEEK
ncbi:hypothetical protein [[Ruminococcus] torques]|uniref:hypothetical protein n=1 Tax=[Ruminococcus] torques TaxID=33039 RepID=UPI0025A33A46|nr:hypothetical protein [[Ruminococcus] torques]MDM8236643.1 hypothetical protein [[Ruminococcus] torques]